MNNQNNMKTTQSKIETLISQLCPNGVEYKTLGEAANIQIGTQLNVTDMIEGGLFPVLNGGVTPSGFYNKFNTEGNTITISQGGASAGYINFVITKFWAGAHCFVIKPLSIDLENRYLYFYLKNGQGYLQNSKQGAGIPGLSKKVISNFRIPIPPLAVQQEIVTILDSFTYLEAELEAELEARKKQYEYYREKLLTFGDGVEYKTLGEVIDYEQPTKYIVESTDYKDTYNTPVLTAGKSFILGYTNETEGIYKASKKNPVIIFDDFTTSFHWVDFNFKIKSGAMKILTIKKDGICYFRFIYFSMKCIKFIPTEHARYWISKYSNFRIPIPPLAVQQEIVTILDSFTYLEAELEAELEARKKQYEYYREKLLTFGELQ